MIVFAGSLVALKGFEIQISGLDKSNRNSNRCVVFNLSNADWSHTGGKEKPTVCFCKLLSGNSDKEENKNY